jgi:signal transduction histidine kinase
MATLPEYRRFTRVNLPVWVIVGAAVLWSVVAKLQGKFVLSWAQLGLLIALALVSAAARTWVGLKDPRVMYRLTLPLVLFDLVLITLATRFTGGFESQIWLLYFALLTSEAAVMPTRLLLVALGLTAVGYGWASAPLAPDQWNDFGFRIAAVSLVSWLIHQVYRSHAEYRMELAELREQYDLAQERERIAREFHDGLGHHLVSAIRGLESIRRRLKAHADTAADCALQEQIDILRTALDDTRQTIQQLRAPETTDMRVFIRQTAERVAQRLGAQLHCDCPDLMPHADSTADTDAHARGAGGAQQRDEARRTPAEPVGGVRLARRLAGDARRRRRRRLRPRHSAGRHGAKQHARKDSHAGRRTNHPERAWARHDGDCPRACAATHRIHRASVQHDGISNQRQTVGD